VRISEENKRNAIANSAANRERNKQTPPRVDWDAVIARYTSEEEDAPDPDQHGQYLGKDRSP
jgi:hypothetical protein